MRNRETDRQADRQTTVYEQMMNIVRRKRGGEGKRKRCFIVLLREEHTYPVRLNQKTEEEEDGWWERKGGGWV